MRTTGERSDARDNRTRLIDGVGILLSRTGSVSLSDLAETAGVSKSTTYRNFSTPQAAIDAYINDFLEDFERQFAQHSPAGAQNPWLPTRTLCTTWGAAISQRSQALTHVRSTEGFLARVRSGDPIIRRIDQTVRSTLNQSLDPNNPAHANIDHGVFLWNLLLDPRELLDLAIHHRSPVRDATAILTKDLLRLLGASPEELADLDTITTNPSD